MGGIFSVPLSADRSAPPLTATLPYSARTFLSWLRSDRPAHSDPNNLADPVDRFTVTVDSLIALVPSDFKREPFAVFYWLTVAGRIEVSGSYRG